MNTVPQPQERQPLAEGEIREVPIGIVKGCSITIFPGAVNLYMGHPLDAAYLTKQEAIDAAKAILIAYGIPFKNAVKGAGL